MGGTMTSGEIEDVLSSIRRLVSEDLRPAPRPQIVSKMVVAEKLILTPALRVVPSAIAPKPATPVQPRRPASLPPSEVAPVVQEAAKAPPPALLPRLHLSADHEVAPATPDVVASLTQAVDQQALDWDFETGDAEPDLDSLDWSSFTFARRSMQESFIARVAAAEVAEHVAVASRSWAQPDPGEAAVSDVPEWPEAHDFHEAASQNDAPMAEDVDDWADVAEAEVLADLGNPAQQEKRAESEVIPGVAQEEDNIFSEQVLRELVRDLIREQLQGDLGERITRNIRKLVKAEIARAMAVHALE